MNVKPGDLAIQIKSTRGMEGRICKVIRYIGFCMYDNLSCDYDTWECEIQSPQFNIFGVRFDAVPISDSWLRPISGIPDTDKVEDEKPVKEVA